MSKFEMSPATAADETVEEMIEDIVGDLDDGSGDLDDADDEGGSDDGDFIDC